MKEPFSKKCDIWIIHKGYRQKWEQVGYYRILQEQAGYGVETFSDT